MIHRVNRYYRCGLFAGARFFATGAEAKACCAAWKQREPKGFVLCCKYKTPRRKAEVLELLNEFIWPYEC